MSFNQFVHRDYLIINPLNPHYNVTSRKNSKIDWYEYKNYSLENPQEIIYEIDYQPDHNTMKNVQPKIEIEEKKES
jgi:hypothetical protein